MAGRHRNGKEKAGGRRQEMDWIFSGIQAHFKHARENIE
jgi:hypothetical protein